MKSIAAPLCAAIFAISALPLEAQAQAQARYEGYAYAAKGNSLLYRESHWQDGPSRIVLYRCPDGKPFARKVVTTGDQPAAPDFLTVDARDGYREGVRSEGSKHTVFYREKKSSEERSAVIDKPDNAIIDGGFDAYIVENWDAMAAGASRKVEFLIPSRLGYTSFAITRQPDGKVSGVPARRYQLKLGAWYGFALPQIDVAYDDSNKRLLQYTGMGNLRDNSGDNLSVRVEFPPAMQGEGAENSIDDPNGVALDGRCAL
ncbi:MAG: hypothetical protein ABIP56_00820 [Dokdonella sp.]